MDIRPIDTNALKDAMRKAYFPSYPPYDDIDVVIDSAPTVSLNALGRGSTERRNQSMNERMTTQEAIHIAAEEAVRCRRLAEDLADNPLDDEEKCVAHAERHRKRAQALETLVRVARAFEQAREE